MLNAIFKIIGFLVLKNIFKVLSVYLENAKIMLVKNLISLFPVFIELTHILYIALKATQWKL